MLGFIRLCKKHVFTRLTSNTKQPPGGAAGCTPMHIAHITLPDQHFKVLFSEKKMSTISELSVHKDGNMFYAAA